IMEAVSIAELAKKMNLKASDIIGKLMNMGMMVTINQQIDAETAEIVAAEYGSSVKVVSLYDETVIDTPEDSEEDLRPRPAIVTVMGHVDHGKTKLLDAIRSENVVGGEFGGITQHIGAYQVETNHGKLTFLDTPGHEAFTLMRARGANVTDIVILVVAADDGVMPQTREAIDHAREAKVPIIVALNKIDKPDANPDRVKQQLSDLDLMPEDWGGSTLYCEVSALKNEGVKELMETVALQSEILELKANHNCRAEGKIIETRIDPGRGTVSSVLIERGTLKVGDAFVAGVYPGRVRAMFNDRGERVQEATPSMPVEILGLTGIPEAGDPFQVTESDKHARQIGDKRQELRKLEDARNVRKITLDNLYDTIQEGSIQELKVVVKGDVHGSVEAVKNALEGLTTDEIRLTAIRAAAGAINENDVMLASASNAIIVGFHVRPTPRAAELAEREKVEIRKYGIIYDAVDDIRTAMEGMLAPELREETVGSVEVREVFKVPKIGTVAGCYVKSGTVTRNANVHVIREGVEIHSGKIESLRRFKDDVRQVEAGYECGIGIQRFDDIKPGDELEVYEVREIAKKLGESRTAKEKNKRES
ncbi:MAG: translation initiation factor IF-2, partial [Spirochaetota bacterium]